MPRLIKYNSYESFILNVYNKNDFKAIYYDNEQERFRVTNW